MRLLPVAALIATLAAVPVLAGIDVGPAIGAKAPALAPTVTAGGTAATLKSIRGEHGTVLIFFRSVKWCPYCKKQMIDFKAATAPLAERGYKLAAISYDDAATQTAFAEKEGITLTFLSDPGSKTIDAWALRDPQYKPDSFAYGVPRPSIFVLDRKGVVRAKLAEDGYKVRPTVEAVLAAVDGVK